MFGMFLMLIAPFALVIIIMLGVYAMMRLAGEPQTEPPAQIKVCPYCHQPIHAGWKACPSCGEKLV